MAPDPDHLLDLFDALAEIEALCASLAAQRAPLASLEGLWDVLGLMDKADPADYPQMAFDFHDRVCRMSGNTVLTRVAHVLRQRLAPLRQGQLGRSDRQERSAAEHRALIAALLDRDGPLAGSIMRAHLRIAMREVLFARGGPPV